MLILLLDITHLWHVHTMCQLNSYTCAFVSCVTAHPLSDTFKYIRISHKCSGSPQMFYIYLVVADM